GRRCPPGPRAAHRLAHKGPPTRLATPDGTLSLPLPIPSDDPQTIGPSGRVTRWELFDAGGGIPAHSRAPAVGGERPPCPPDRQGGEKSVSRVGESRREGGGRRGRGPGRLGGP